MPPGGLRAPPKKGQRHPTNSILDPRGGGEELEGQEDLFPPERPWRTRRPPGGLQRSSTWLLRSPRKTSKMPKRPQRRPKRPSEGPQQGLRERAHTPQLMVNLLLSNCCRFLHISDTYGIWIAQEGPNTASEWPNNLPRTPQGDPTRVIKRAPEGLRPAPKGPQRAPKTL